MSASEQVDAAIAELKTAAVAAAKAEAAAIAAAASPAVPGAEKPKIGFLTSEFWLAATALASNVLTHSGLVASASDNQHTMSTIGSAIVAVVLCVQYVTGRTVLKSCRGDGGGVKAFDAAAAAAGLVKPADVAKPAETDKPVDVVNSIDAA